MQCACMLFSSLIVNQEYCKLCTLLIVCSTPNHLYLKQWSRYCRQLSPEEVQSVLFKVLNPVKDLIPFPSTDSSDVTLSTQTTTESKVVSESSSGSSHESLVKESFPDVTDLKLVPLPPLPLPSSTESGGGGEDEASPDFLIDEHSLPKSKDGETLSPPMQSLPPLPVSSCLTTPTVIAMPTVSLANMDKEVKKSIVQNDRITMIVGRYSIQWNGC